MRGSKMLAVLMLLCALTLSGCGPERAGGKQAEAYQPEDVQAMVEAGAFSETLEELDGDVAFGLYRLADVDLNREDLTDCAVVRSAGATCEEGAVLVFQTSDQAVQALQALEAYLVTQVEANEEYRPAEIPKLEGAYLSQVDNTLLLVVANDLEVASAALIS